MEAVADAAEVGKPLLYTAVHCRTGDRARAGTSTAWSGARGHPHTISPQSGRPGPARRRCRPFCGASWNPTRWRLILPCRTALRQTYRATMRSARSQIVAQAEELAKTGMTLDPRLAQLDPVLCWVTLCVTSKCWAGSRLTVRTAIPANASGSTRSRAMTMFAGAD